MTLAKKVIKRRKKKCRDCNCDLKYKYETVICFHCYLKATKRKK